MWIKARYFLKEKKHIPKGEKYLSESSHEGEVARKGGGTKGEIMVLGGGQVIIGLSFDHQNHSKWHKWCHVRFKVEYRSSPIWIGDQYFLA